MLFAKYCAEPKTQALFVGSDYLECPAECRFLISHPVLETTFLDAPIPVLDRNSKLDRKIDRLGRRGARVVKDGLNCLRSRFCPEQAALSATGKRNYDNHDCN